MSEPRPDDERMVLALAAEAGPTGQPTELLGEDESSEQVVAEGTEATGITSHVFSRRGSRATSKSTFRPPHTTDAVWTRVAFFTAETVRLGLSDWKLKGPANPYQTLIQQWYFDDPRARRALVLWWMNGNTWRSWAD